MQFKFALLSSQSASGEPLAFAVFGARPADATEAGGRKLLDQLTSRARAKGLSIDQSALAYTEGDQVRFFASGEILDYLEKNGLPPWTHFLEA